MTTMLLLIALVGQVAAQNVRPQIGYIYPTGGRVGSSVEVQLGTYDWTPDMQVLVHDPSIKLELTGPIGDFKMTPPPYWFGTKASITQPPLAREVPAKLTIPDGQPIGPVHWQVANANGGSNAGTFIVSDLEEFVEPDRHGSVIALPVLPIAVSGRISNITDSDTYRFTTKASGLVTCRLHDRLGQPFNAVLTIHDQQGRIVADTANTTGSDETILMFDANSDEQYTVNVHDVNFGGDAAYVYRMTLEQGPQVVATLPCVLARGQTTVVEFIGWGLLSGSKRLESLKQEVSVPESMSEQQFAYLLPTAYGEIPVTLSIDATSDTVEPESHDISARTLTCPASITGTFAEIDPATQMPTKRYAMTASKGATYHIAVEASRWGSKIDPGLVIVSAAGKEVLRNDDVVDSVDIYNDFTAPEDGVYEIILSDQSGQLPSRENVYRITIEDHAQAADFALDAPERIDIPLGGQADLVVKTIRRGTWDEPIVLSLENLPAGVTFPAAPAIANPTSTVPAAKPAKRSKKAGPKDSKISLTAASDVAAEAKLATLVATATMNDQRIVRRSQPILLSTTLKTRCKVKSAVQDGGRIVNRGTTYPADVVVERLEGYSGPIELQMAATQQRQRRGIRGPKMTVASGVDEVQYPVFMPEWLETSLTARMNVIGIAQVADPVGNVRHVTGIMDGFIVMSLEGALLKLSHEPKERLVQLGSTIEVPLKISRSVKLQESVRVEWVPDAEEPYLVSCQPIIVPVSSQSAAVSLQLGSESHLVGNRSITLRATALQMDVGQWFQKRRSR